MSPFKGTEHGLLNIIFLKDGVYNLKEIGKKLKETRENIGISIEEASEDLKVLPSQIEAIESGDMDRFKDVFSVKYFIRDYAKYLGLSYEEMVDEFNEYLFDYTSKISLDDIKKAKKKDKPKEVRIASPYTIEHKKPHNTLKIVLIIASIIVAIISLFLIINAVKNNNEDESIIAFVKEDL